MSDKCPCRGCEDRQAGCHGSCELYVKWRKVMDHISELRHADQKVATLENGWFSRVIKAKLRRGERRPGGREK